MIFFFSPWSPLGFGNDRPVIASFYTDYHALPDIPTSDGAGGAHRLTGGLPGVSSKGTTCSLQKNHRGIILSPADREGEEKKRYTSRCNSAAVVSQNLRKPQSGMFILLWSCSCPAGQPAWQYPPKARTGRVRTLRPARIPNCALPRVKSVRRKWPVVSGFQMLVPDVHALYLP